MCMHLDRVFCVFSCTLKGMLYSPTCCACHSHQKCHASCCGDFPCLCLCYAPCLYLDLHCPIPFCGAWDSLLHLRAACHSPYDCCACSHPAHTCIAMSDSRTGACQACTSLSSLSHSLTHYVVVVVPHSLTRSRISLAQLAGCHIHCCHSFTCKLVAVYDGTHYSSAAHAYT